MIYIKQVFIVAFIFMSSHYAFCQRVRGKIEESKFDRKLNKERERAFTPWMTVQGADRFVLDAKQDGKVLLALDRKSNGLVRVIMKFAENGKEKHVTYFFYLKETELLNMHMAVKKKDAYNLLYLKQNPDGVSYCASWIVKHGYDKAVSMLKGLGVSSASIEIKSSQSAMTPNKKQAWEKLTDWVKSSEFQSRWPEETKKGGYTLYIESNRKGELRAIWDKRASNLQWQYKWRVETEKNLRRVNYDLEIRDYTLLSLSYQRSTDMYSAVWVARKNYENSKAQLKNANYSTASIGKKIQVSKELKP